MFQPADRWRHLAIILEAADLRALIQPSDRRGQVANAPGVAHLQRQIQPANRRKCSAILAPSAQLRAVLQSVNQSCHVANTLAAADLRARIQTSDRRCRVANAPGAAQFEGWFNQPVEGNVLPSSLHQLKLGPYFKRTINCVAWPVSLRQLTLWEHLTSLSKMWPRHRLCISLLLAMGLTTESKVSRCRRRLSSSSSV